MSHWAVIFSLFTLVAASGQAMAQTKEEVKSKISSNVCDCLQKKEAENPFDMMSKEQATATANPCFASGVAKELAGIQTAYGTNSFSNADLMRQIGREVAGEMMQSCPTFLRVSMAMAKPSSSTAATTGQTVGRLGKLHGTGLALLDIEISKTEQAQFAWLQRPTEGNALLGQLAQLKGKLVRVSWQEIDVLDPTTATYKKLRQLTGIAQQ